MHRSLRRFVLLLAIGLASWLGSRWLSEFREVGGVATPSTPVTAEPLRVAGFSPPAAPPTQALVPPRSPTVNPALGKAFSTSTNYREFIRFAKTDIEHGGGAYASYAQIECGYVRTVFDALKRYPQPPPEGSKDIVALAEARTLLEARCGALSKEETWPLVSQQLRKAGGDDVDPLLRIEKLIYEPAFKTDPDARRRFIALALETGDPMLWARYSSSFVRQDRTETAYFDGVTYSGNDAIALVSAVSLEPCGLGFECARTDTIVAATCLQSRVCEHDRYALEKLKADHFKYDFQQVIRFQDALIAAVAAQNVDAFIKP